ncbi:MAG: hypothetical protein RSC68_00180 [Acinetobacter sp.]
MSIQSDIQASVQGAHVSLVQIQCLPEVRMYHVVMQREVENHTVYAVALLTKQTMLYLWNQMTSQQQMQANFSIGDNGITCLDTAVQREVSELPLSEFCSDVIEKEPNIWGALTFLKRLGASVLIGDGCRENIVNARFSFSTPSVTIGAYTTVGYRTRTLWSYEPDVAADEVKLVFDNTSFLKLCTSPYAKFTDIGQAVYDNGSVTAVFHFDLLTACYASEVDTHLSFSPSALLYFLGQYDLFSTALDGLNCAYRFMRYRNGVRFSKVQSQGYSASRDYLHNIKINRNLRKPNLTQVNKLLYDEQSSYWRDKLSNCEEEDLDKLFKDFLFKNSTEEFSKMFLLGFKLIYNKMGFIKDIEYKQYSSQIKSILFKTGLSFFKMKITMMDIGIDYCVNTPYEVNGGIVVLEKQNDKYLEDK